MEQPERAAGNKLGTTRTRERLELLGRLEQTSPAERFERSVAVERLERFERPLGHFLPLPGL